MKKIVIIGNGSYARRIKKYIEFSDWGEIQAYTADSEYINENLLDGIPCIAFKELEKRMKPDEVELVMGIGYRQMGDIRRRIFEIYKTMGYTFANFIHPSATISPDLVIGQGNVILEGVIIEPNVSIGNANLIFSGTTVGHDSTLGSYNTLCGRVLMSSQNRVGNHCYFGDCSVLSPGIVVEDYVLMGAMTRTNKDLLRKSVVMPDKNRVIEGEKSKIYFEMFVK